ncbi:hypothetical protein HWC07_gp125 [Pantoea phage vB_PagM_LIET2]|uniref:Uncharacterized protein n=1 Tax=Pantoea phage vB_PagM_LIET2 TaxID=2508071 RepID=A0A411AW90_9CAUD|nr:hypothetical protein HWC07_gp125 [Pantoea phage vB_PagM_LIET2]QAX92377.1 hypothetical protein LIET2_gp125 [Pantoea phage vB_PagM_LIET2]
MSDSPGFFFACGLTVGYRVVNSVSTTYQGRTMKTEIDCIVYHNLTMEAACVERRVNDSDITKARKAKLYTDAGICWLQAMRRSKRDEVTYAERRLDFCRAALIRLGRHDLAQQLDATR